MTVGERFKRSMEYVQTFIFVIFIPSTIIIFLIWVLSLFIHFAYDKYRSIYPSEMEVTAIGNLIIYKDGNTYHLNYSSNIDKVVTSGQIPNSLELGSIRTVINAAIDKHFEEVKIPYKCITEVSKEYKKTAMAGSYQVLNCSLYADYEQALKLFDRDLYVEGMINHKRIHSDENWGDEKERYVNLLRR